MTEGTIDSWVQSLTEESMPIFSGTVGAVTGQINSSSSSASDVAHSVLQDAALTSRLLKLANSFTFNPSGREISTVSRAVMILGFEQVKSLTLSLVLIDSLVSGVQRQRLTSEMADAFHAAMQAEALAKSSKIKKPENVFVASLLSRIGNMAFWAFASEEQSQKLDHLLSVDNIDEQEAERKVLGFSLRDLTKSLGESWNLGSALSSFISGETSQENQLILEGQKLAKAAKKGWKSDEAKQSIESIARSLNQPYLDIQEIVLGTAKQAQKITRIYGGKEASKQIPQPNSIENLDEETEIETIIENEIPEVKAVSNKGIEPDPQLQLTIMQDIASAIEERPSLNIILEMVLEGIHRGVGMDRCFFAILAPDRKKMMCKYALGTDNERLCKELLIPLTSEENLLSKSIIEKKAMYLEPTTKISLIPEQVQALIGPPPYLIMPAIVKGKVIGLFMADRNESKREIFPNDFIAFQQLCQQANMGMTFLTSKG
jgi:HD-like signal output (HDOD) protein